MKIEEVAMLVEFLSAQYPSWRAPANTVAAWYSTLGTADAAAILTSARRWSVVNKWPPSVAELVEGTLTADGSAPAPEDVMAEVLHAARKTPWGIGPRGLSETAQRVVDCLGWSYVRDSDNPMALRAHILKVAEHYCRRDIGNRALAVVGLPATPEPVALPHGREAYIPGSENVC